MKKIITLAFLTLFSGLFAPQVLFAAQNTQGFIPLAPIPGLTTNLSVNGGSMAPFFNNLYKYLVGIAAVLAIIMIVWSGLQIMLNRDSVSTAISSKGKISNAVFGLILVLSPVLVFSIINPSILNLSLNVPGLELSKAWGVCQLGSGGYGVWNPNVTSNNCQAGQPNQGNPCVDASGHNIPFTVYENGSCTAISITACRGGQFGTTWGVQIGSQCDTSQAPPSGASCTLSGGGSGQYDATQGKCVAHYNPAADVTACQSGGSWGVWQAIGTFGSGTCDTSQTPPNGARCTTPTANGFGQIPGTFNSGSCTPNSSTQTSGSSSGSNTSSNNSSNTSSSNNTSQGQTTSHFSGSNNVLNFN